MLSPNLPLISIIIPYYNCKEYIAEALQSIEMQTYMNIETIVVNDGSDRQNTAYIESLIQRKKAEQKNIHYAYQTNKGVSSARNTGGRLACGDYILFLDADDKLHPEFIQKTLSAFIHTPNCILAYSKSEYFDAATGERPLPPLTGLKSLLMGNRIPTNSLHKMSDFIRLHGFDESLRTHEDWDYWIRLLKDGGAVSQLNEVLFYYRKRMDGSSLIDGLAKNADANQRSWQAVYDKNKELFLQHNLSFFDLVSSVANAENWQKKYEEMSAVQVTTLATQNHVLNQQTALIEQINALQEKLAEHEPIIKGQQEEIKLWQKKYEDSIQENNAALNQYNTALSYQLGLVDKNDKLQKDLIAAAQEALSMKAENEQLLAQHSAALQEKLVIENTLTHVNNVQQGIVFHLEQQSHTHRKFKNLVILQLLKPFIKLELGLHSLNRYRKAFKVVIKEQGSFGKAYQFIRRMYQAQGLFATKQYLRARFLGQPLPLLQENNNNPSPPPNDEVATYFHTNNDVAYQTWIKNNDTYTADDYQSMENALQTFGHKPIISIIMPVYNVDIKWLKQAIDSVRAQVYPHWQLCISDDASTNTDIKPLLEQYIKEDERIFVVFREKNGHISENSNSALSLAHGEWIALMDHDDVLPKHALFEVVKTLQDKPDSQLIYSDEDKVDEHGRRFMPHFKSDFNLDLLYGQNYISHLGVYKTVIAKDIGGFRKGFEGSQDYDFLLRYLFKIQHKNVTHIPKILYHWRAIEGSTALASGEKSYTTEAGLKALADYFIQMRTEVNIGRSKADNLYRVQWHLKEEPLVSLIIPTYNALKITKQAIDSILTKTTYKNYEILLVDNNSDDPEALAYFNEIDKHEKITVLRYPYPFNYSAINNFAVKHAKGEVIGLINNDIEVISEEWLTEMVSQAVRKDIGCVGAMLYYPNNTIQHAGVIMGIGGVAGHSHKHLPKDSHGYFSRLYITQNLTAVTAACLVVRKSIFNEVGGLNEEDLTVAFNDVDFCLKVHHAGYRNLWTPYAELYHHESISRGYEDNPEKIVRFQKEVEYMMKTWHTNTTEDKYYNPNLTWNREDFAIDMQSRVKR